LQPSWPIAGSSGKSIPVNFYHITIVDGIPGIHGPYLDAADRSHAAKHFWFGAMMGRDLILKLDIDDHGRPTLEMYDPSDLDLLYDFLLNPPEEEP